ncbi:MAG TPA: FCD domain-containing protein [Amycolatopsis sp.]|nr:FCD domain-containing protein [Amycolatopsis sp.]
MTGERELSTPVRPVSAAKAVAERLIAAIAVGDYRAGERLPPERDLADMLAVSRVTVRTALADLRKAGYVEIRRGRAGGSFVRQDWGERTPAEDAARLEQVLDLQRLVESLIARTAAERHTPEDDATIRAALERYEHAKGPSARSADAELHRTIAAAAHNPLLGDLSRQLLTRVSLCLSREPFPPALWEMALPQHRALVEAVTSGEPDKAASVARDHFRLLEQALRPSDG